ncbi:MAG: outer membrane beta-barrel protein [Colwellia sp.]|nr:outer membrane beta-barrel protein [Colwellia sp.]
MLKIIISLVIVLCFTSFSTLAKWQVGMGIVDVLDFQYDSLGNRYDTRNEIRGLTGISASLGYKYESWQQLYFIPVLMLATGINKEKHDFPKVTVELEHLVSLSMRMQYEFDNDLYVYTSGSYNNFRSKFSTTRFDDSAVAYDAKETFGFGAGLGYNFSVPIAAELDLVRLDNDIFLINLGIKYSF